MKNKIRIDTFSEAQKFVDIASRLKGNITITDDTGFVVNAKSLLGVLYAMEFETLWCNSDSDIYRWIEPFVINE